MNLPTVKTIREALGLNQAQFAQLLGVHPMTVSKWECGNATPNAYQATLVQNFGVAAENPEVRKNIESALIGMGVGFALALLLNHLLKK